jgi:hypothetical protein
MSGVKKEPGIKFMKGVYAGSFCWPLFMRALSIALIEFGRGRLFFKMLTSPHEMRNIDAAVLKAPKIKTKTNGDIMTGMPMSSVRGNHSVWR